MMENADTQTATRRPRFRRHRLIKPSFALQPRDVAIVRLVSEFRVISSDDLRLLLPGSDQGILRRLQRLFHHGYLDRPRSQRQRGNSPMVYALGQRGAELVAETAGHRPRIDWTEKNRQLQTRHLEHALMVSRFRVALSHAAQVAGTVAVERWLPDGCLRDAVVVEHRDRRDRIPVAPDALFTLRLDTGETIHAFLEADRGTMDVPRFVTKLRGYYAYWRSGQQQERIGAKNCLVVTITRSAERATNLLVAARSVSDRGLRMFLFAPETAYLPAAGRAVFDPVWRTPADGQMHTLLE